MDKGTLISVIVPVYNVETYLEDCLNSMIQQSYANLEILVVDDGSTDGSAEICDRFAAKDDRIRVSHQPNSGVAAARREAVLRAAGDYICFVDSDDKMDTGMVEFLVRNIGGCDVITCGCYCERVNGEFFEQTDYLEEGVYDDADSMQYLISNMLIYQQRFEYGIQPYLVNKMFRAPMLKEVVSGIRSRLSYAEDGEVLFQYLLRCRAVRITHTCLYYYRYRPDSALHMVNDNYLRDLNGIYLALKAAFEKHPQREALLRQLYLFVTARIYAIPTYMRFPEDAQLAGYVFPFSDLEPGTRIVLYGAGNIGLRYYQQIFRQKELYMVLWVDKQWERYRKTIPVTSPEELAFHEYDYIIIAVKKETLAEEIRRELTAKDIAGEKILWRIPARL